jgi:TIR domain/Caspase domain/Type III restriction enzyme, res subunit/Restriction endonuclease
VADRALLIGVGQYRSLPALPAASSDMDELTSVLKNPFVGGYEATRLTETHSDDLANAVESFCLSARRDDRLLLYIACHGIDYGGDHYLAATDTDLGEIRQTAIRTEDLLNWVGQSEASSIVVILNACSSGRVEAASLSRIETSLSGSRVGIIYSSRLQDQYSNSSGRSTLFTDALIEGLRGGEADTNRDGIVGFQDLCDYLSSRFDAEASERPGSLGMVLTGPDFQVAVSHQAAIEGRPTRIRPPTPSLRYYQADAVRAIQGAIIAGERQMVVQMAPGTGKSLVIAHSIHQLMDAGLAHRILYLTDRVVIKDQMSQVLSSTEVEDGLTIGGLWPVSDDLRSLAPGQPSTQAPDAPAVLVCTIQALKAFLQRHGTKVPVDLFDVTFIDATFTDRTSDEAKSWQDSITYFDAPRVAFSSGGIEDPLKGLGHVAFRYDLHSAIRDGVLVDRPIATLRARATTWPEFNRSDQAHVRRRVFLSYAAEDVVHARRIASHLKDAGVSVWFREGEGQGKLDPTKEALAEIHSREVFVILLSPAAVRSPWVNEELDAALERRSIDVIPAIVRYCAVPKSLADRAVVDATHGIDGLLRRLQASAQLDLEPLEPDTFESLTRELLLRLHFRLEEISSSPDVGYFSGTFHDPLGFADETTYIIKVRLARTERPSVRLVRELADLTGSAGSFKRSLLITNGHLTSVALRAVDDINKGTTQLRVIDGPQLRALLLMHPDLISKYFPSR